MQFTGDAVYSYQKVPVLELLTGVRSGAASGSLLRRLRYALVGRLPCNGHIYSVPSLCFGTLQIWSAAFTYNFAFFLSAKLSSVMARNVQNR